MHGFMCPLLTPADIELMTSKASVTRLYKIVMSAPISV
jgi:hypothetical protein